MSTTSTPPRGQAATSRPKSVSPGAKSFPILVQQFSIDGAEWRCRHCDKTFSIRNATRARAHFSAGDTSLSTCTKANSVIFSDVLREYTSYLSKRASMVRTFSQREDSPDDDTDLATTASEMNDELLKFFVTSNIAFRAVENRHLRRLFHLAQCSWFNVPSRRDMASTILTRVSSLCDTVHSASFASNKAMYGCTVASDGWSTRGSINFINCMLVSGDQEVFHSCQSDGEFKKAKNIADVISSVIEDVGSEAIVQICVDGAARHCFKFLRTKYPTLFFTWCAAHSVDLLLEDICQDSEIQQTLSEAKDLISLIMNHHALLQGLRKRSSRVLIRHAVTRFATHFLCIDRILYCKEALLGLLTSEEFLGFVSTQESAKRPNSQRIQHTCGNVMWFDKVSKLQSLMKPIYVMLREADGIKPGLAGKMYYKLFLLQEALEDESTSSLLHSFSRKTRVHVRNALSKRWRAMHNPIYSVGFLLDPEFMDTTKYGQYQCTDVMDDWHATVSTLFPNHEEGTLPFKPVYQFVPPL
jgi:hypothetical protein